MDLFDYAQKRPVAADPTALLGDLNPPQREAVEACDGPLLVLAGAGSGKTRAITRKIAWLVEQRGFRPWEILAVTFTNKAAGEMRERCKGLLGEAADDLWLGTFHSIGVRVLRRHGELLGLPRSFVIYDRDDMKAMLKRVLAKENLDEQVFPPRDVMAYIDRAKQRAEGPDHPELPRDGLREQVLARVYEAYEAAMREAGAVDFGDLIRLPLKLFRSEPLIASEYKQRWRYVLVDEFQDTNFAQNALLETVLNDARRICVVGDDDQSIYRWRGAEVANILEFDRRFPDATVVRFEQNYRSSGHILAASGALIAQNRGRHGKTLWTERDLGEPVVLFEAESETDEAQWVARTLRERASDTSPAEMAVFYRTNAQSRALEEALRREGLPHRVVGGLRFYDRAEVKDVLAYLKVIANPLDVVSLERIINTPTRGIGRTTVQKIRDRAAEDAIPTWQALQTLADEGEGALKRKLGAFVSLMREFQDLAQTGTALEVAVRVVERTKYLERLASQRTAEADAKRENVEELLNAVGQWVDQAEDDTQRGLAGFLDSVTLASELDSHGEGEPAVSLMTGHTAKGLEFDVVFVTGLEEGLFPHFNSQDTEDDVEEERRLLYVAMTRARHRLHLSHATTRRRFGAVKSAEPSRFVAELPQTHVEVIGLAARRGFHSAASAGSGWGSSWGGGGSFGGSAGRPRAGRGGRRSSDDFSQAMPSYEDFSQLDGAGEGGDLVAGRGVFHPKFGEGLVESVSSSGSRTTVKVRFADGISRKIDSRFVTPL